MKKIIIAIAAMAIAASASAQVKLGVRSVANINTFGGVELLDNQSKALDLGANVAFVCEYGLNNVAKGFGVRAEVGYSMKGYSIHTEGKVLGVDYNNMTKTSINYVNIPVMAEYKIMNGDLAFMFGPQLGIATGGRTTFTDKLDSKNNKKDTMDPDDFKKIVNGTNFSLVFGAEYMFSKFVGVDVRYDLGLSKVYKEVDLGLKTIAAHGTSSALQVGVVVLF